VTYIDDSCLIYMYIDMVRTVSAAAAAAASSESATYYNNFINSIRSEATKNQYIYCLQKYMKYYKLDNVEDLLLHVEKPKLIQADIIQYVVWLKQTEKISSSTIRLYLSAILHFYSMNDIVLNRKKIGMYVGETVRKQKKDRAYTTEEIHKILDFCDERSKALVFLLCSTGIRIGAIPDLQLSHLKKIAEYNLYQVTVYEGTKEEYFTFTTPEAASTIDVYLDYRRRYGEKLTDNSPLFREQFDINDQFSIRYTKRITLRNVINILEERLKRSGIVVSQKLTEGERLGSRRNPVPRAHGFRKFVTTNMVRAKLNPEAREMLLGHSIGLSDAYYRPDENELLEEYLKAVDLLTINEENRLRMEVETLRVEKSKVDELALEISRLKESLQL
jgi:integrase